MDISYFTAFLPNLSPVQLLLVAFLILLLFGAKRLPELGRGLGRFLREFKRTTHEIEEDIRSSLDAEPEKEKAKEKEKPAARENEGEEEQATPERAVERVETKSNS